MTLHTLADIKQSRAYKNMEHSSTQKTEEQRSLKRRRDMAYAVLKRARRDGGRDDEDALRRAYEEARVTYAEMRNNSGMAPSSSHGRGLATYLHADVECETEIETM